MPYFTPPGGEITAAYGRSLMGLGPMGYYARGFRRDLNGLGALRFNRSVARGMYKLPFTEPQPRRRLGGLGMDVSPSLMLGGLGVLAAAFYLLGGKFEPKRKQRRAARLRRKLQELEG
jgi:hypothetical protein